MAKKKSSKKKKKVPKVRVKEKVMPKVKHKKVDLKNVPTLNLKTETDIAMDFATKIYKKFDKIIKSIVLFGSSVKHDQTAGSDIDIVVLIDDVSIKWDQELIAWYREELGKIINVNPYAKNLHINTVKLSTWWDDLMRGDPVILNILRYGEAMIDMAGFFNPLKYLLIQGKIKATPEAIYSALQRAPMHLVQSKAAELAAIEGLYWAMVDSAHAALIAAGQVPPSPEHIPAILKETFVNSGKLKKDYIIWYRDLHVLHKEISHRKINDLKGVEIDAWQDKAEKFLQKMIELVDEIVK